MARTRKSTKTMTWAFLSAVAVALCFASEAAAEEITAKLKVGEGVGVGFGELSERTQTLTINLKAPDDWLIKWSKVRDKSGRRAWKPHENNTTAQIHKYEVTGLVPEDGHAVGFDGKLTKEGKGGDPPAFDAAVADIDIDVDSLGLHTDEPAAHHWPPVPKSDSRAYKQDAVEGGDSSGGLCLPASLVTGALPLRLPLDSPYKLLALTLRPKWVGPPNPPTVGDLTLDVTAPGVALYHVSKGTKVTRPIRVPSTRRLYRLESGASPNLPPYGITHAISLSITVSAGASAATCAQSLVDAWNLRTDTSGVRAALDPDRPGLVQFFVRRTEAGGSRDYNMPLETLEILAVPSGVTYTKGYSDAALVKKLVSTQGAVPASSFDSEVPMTLMNGTLYMNGFLGLFASGQYPFPGTPDVYGRYPGYRVTTNTVQRPYFKVLESQYAPSTFWRFFNPSDYATQNCWEADQAAKPAQWGVAPNYYYHVDPPVGDANIVYYDKFGRHDRAFLFPRDSMEVFAYAAQGRISLGSAPPGNLTTGLYSGARETDMSSGGGYNMDNRHIFHSAQFNMDLAWHPVDGRGLCWVYWRDVLGVAVRSSEIRLLPDAP